MRPGGSRTWLALGVTFVLVAGCAGQTATPSGPPNTASPSTASPSVTAVPATPSPATPSPTVIPSPTPVTRVPVTIFLLADGLVAVEREVESGPDMVRAALEALLAGPVAAEAVGRYPDREGSFAPLTSAIPEETRILDVRVDPDQRLVVVDLSAGFLDGADDAASIADREAQIVYTATAAAGLDRVRFEVEGAPIDVIEGHEGSVIVGPALRRHFWDQLPPVFIESPAWGGQWADPLIATGRAQLLGDAFRAALVDGAGDRVVVETTVVAPCAPGCWQPPGGGAFEFTLDAPDGAVPDPRLRVWTAPPNGWVLEMPLLLAVD